MATAVQQIASYAKGHNLPFKGCQYKCPAAVSPAPPIIEVMKHRPPISYEEVLRLEMDVWSDKSLKAAQAAAAGQRCVEPVQYEGVARLHAIRRDFGAAVAMWQPYQSMVFEMLLNANIPNILGKDCDRCLERVMRDSKWTDVPDEMLVVAARGSGKSTMLACAVAAFFKNIPDYTAMVYSGIQSKGNDLLDSIYAAFIGMCEKDPTFAPEHIRKTATTISFSVDGNVRQIRAASSLGMVCILNALICASLLVFICMYNTLTTITIPPLTFYLLINDV